MNQALRGLKQESILISILNTQEAAMSMLSLSFTVILQLLLLLLSSRQSVSIQHCHRKDMAALLEIKRSFGNPPSWSSWNSSIDCCSWYIVSCDLQTGRVNGLFIFRYSDITGPISPAIGHLSALRWLQIQANYNLTGTIPRSIAKLTSLYTLVISGNPRLTGTIPKSICKLPELVLIDLSNNNITRRVPGRFGSKLSYVDFSGNQLTGRIPASFTHGSRPADASVQLFLHRNQLTGPLPRTFGNINFRIIDISRNRLTGDASFLLGENKSRLEELILSENQLEFDFSNVSFPLGIQKLYLDHNKIYGRIRPQMSKLGWFQLDLSYNDLCGPIPEGLEALGSSSFEHNKCLCGGPLLPCT